MLATALPLLQARTQPPTVPASSGPPGLAAAGASSTSSSPAAAPRAWLTEPVEARHEGYRSIFIELPVPEGAATPLGTISGTAYLKDPPRNGGKAAPRPLLFLFNGGPGASSTPLHLNAIGPRRFIERPGRTPERQLEPNTQTVLDAMDLVFIDPPGTGFSQVFETGRSALWTTETDARVAAGFVRCWLKKLGRENSPVYIGGQSYGGFRLASMMRYASDLPPLSGLVFISPLLDASATSASVGNELAYALQFPSMVVAAWQHGKGQRGEQGRSVEEVFSRAEDFARGVYLPALLEGSRLSAKRAGLVAARMSGLLGMSPGELLAQRLRPDSEQFLTTVLGRPEARLGRLDTRVIGSTAPPPPGRPTNDPSLVVSSAPAGRSLTPTEAYFREELNVPITRKYVPLSFTVNGGWNYFDRSIADGFYINPTRYVAEVMRQQPALRLLYVGGYYDMAVPVAAAQYALEHADLPMARVQMQLLPGSHNPYDDEANLQRFTQRLREFVR
ncbi:Carboxypeptidase C (cathepsin A) [Roseateles sp. YR242]|nr:Carboxypeptidase C (cathepsin A) [Roseateles sp. YR242]